MKKDTKYYKMQWELQNLSLLIFLEKRCLESEILAPALATSMERKNRIYGFNHTFSAAMMSKFNFLYKKKYREFGNT